MKLLAVDSRLSRSSLTVASLEIKLPSQLGKVFHCVEVGAVDVYMRRTVGLSWRGLVQQADGEAEVLGRIREAAYDVL